MKIDLSKMTPAQREQLERRGIAALESVLGITTERAKDFIELSYREHPEKDAAWHRDDAVGKFKRFLRVSRKWQGAVDVAWKFIEPYAGEVVDAVLALDGGVEDE